MTFEERYRKTEDTVVNIVKELTWAALICFLVYRVLTEAPPSAQFEEWAKNVFVLFGAALIPGLFMKIYWLFTGIWTKIKNV